MNNHHKKKDFSEKDIINIYLTKLNFKKKETFNFKNDGALLKNKKNKEIVVTNDTILESVDFFKFDDPESIAQKIITYNLSDISSMGANPYCYTLSLSLPKWIGVNWIKKFTKKLFYLQKKHKIFLLGGDISKSRQIVISANFYGYIEKNLVLKREFPKIGDTIWVTGNIGDTYIGLLFKKKKLFINHKFQKYFINKYNFPETCMIGSKLINISSSAIDISDGFYGDLLKLLNKKKLGAHIIYSQIPFSRKAKYLLKNNFVSANSLLTGGDDYQLIFTTSSKHDNEIINISKKNKCKISKVGRIINKHGIFVDGKKLMNSMQSFQYFF